MVTPKGEKFVECVDTSGETKDAQYVADVVGNAIEKVGADNVAHVCMDSAAVCKHYIHFRFAKPSLKDLY